MFCVENLSKISITLGGKIWMAAFKLVNTKWFVFPRIKVYKYIRIYQSSTFTLLRCQTACFEELLNQQKIRVKVKYIRKIYDVIGLHSLTRQDLQH